MLESVSSLSIINPFPFSSPFIIKPLNPDLTPAPCLPLHLYPEESVYEVPGPCSGVCMFRKDPRCRDIHVDYGFDRTLSVFGFVWGFCLGYDDDMWFRFEYGNGNRVPVWLGEGR